MNQPLDGSCPNCDAQIVLYDWGFRCSVCDYDLPQWTAFLSSMRSKLPLHTDSPALQMPEVAFHE